jgi:hypothetical protein
MPRLAVFAWLALALVALPQAQGKNPAALRGGEGEHNQMFAVLKRIDDVLDKEMSVLSKDTENESTSKALSTQHRFMKKVDFSGTLKMVAGKIQLAGSFIKMLYNSKVGKFVWFTLKVGAALTVAFACPPVAAAFVTALVVAKGFETIASIAESATKWQAISDLETKGELTKTMAAACKATVGVKFVASVFLSWAALIVPLEFDAAEIVAGGKTAADLILPKANEVAVGYNDALLLVASEMSQEAETQLLNKAEATVLTFNCEGEVLADAVADPPMWQYVCEDDDPECISLDTIYPPRADDDQMTMTENPMKASS